MVSASNPSYGTTTFSYDVQGNLATENGVQYQFDYGNRLRNVPGKEFYTYDAWGHRQRAKSDSLGEILWLYARDGKPAFMANRRIGGTQSVYLYLGNQLVATQQYAGSTAPVYYQTTDMLGSIIAQTNNAAWVDHFNYYTPWGSLQTGTLDDGPGYAGQINDTNTGLSYAQQRYYDPNIPRFMSVDPVDANTVTGSNFNRYIYAADNPYRYYDPDGMQCTGALTKGGCGIYETPTQFQSQQSALSQTLHAAGQVAIGVAKLAYDAWDSIRPGPSEGQLSASNQSQAAGMAGGTILLGIGAAAATDDPALAEAGESRAISSYRSFSAFKRAEGAAGDGMQWHHIVEQTPGNIASFGPEAIHNTGNIVPLDVATHRQISGFYSSKPLGSDMTIRQWLGTQSFEQQYNFGQQTLQDFGGGQ